VSEVKSKKRGKRLMRLNPYFVCEGCGKLTYRRSYNQKYCKECRKKFAR